jgi:hypothetical protein
MNEDLDKQLDHLERTLADFEIAAKQALGFVRTVRYRDVSFDISRRFVIADLAPLAFFHLVEHIGADGAEMAVIRLYERLMPLLSCRHEWTELRRVTDEHMRNLANDMSGGNSHSYLCKHCTAYAFGGPNTPLPVRGRILPQ